MKIYPLNACKLNWAEKRFDFNAESIVFGIKILFNTNLIINDSGLNNNMTIDTHLDQTQTMK